MNVRTNIRITLEYHGKKEGAHQFKVSFYNPEQRDTTSCMMDIQYNGSHMYPEVGKDTFDIPCNCPIEKSKILDLTSSLGKVYVAGLGRKPTYFWTDK